jgi:hypothetical protein
MMSTASEHPGASDDLSPSDRFYWNLLGDLVFEDSYALWEASGSTDPVFNELPAEDPRAHSPRGLSSICSSVSGSTCFGSMDSTQTTPSASQTCGLG